MGFDPCEHRIRQIIIKAGKLLREAKGLPTEKNITILYDETALLFGIEPIRLSSTEVDHLPTPEESARANSDNPLVQICPKCGEKSYVPSSICQGCKESENGKYKMKLECYRCKHSERLEKWLVQWMNENQIEIPDGMKRNLGIKTVTDDGLK